MTVSTAFRGEAATRPWIGFAVDRRLGSAILIASGPSQAEVESAIEALAGPTERPPGVPRTEVDTITWRAPDAPLIVGERSVRLANLDIGTQEFSGRRFRTEFSVALPADFYAEFYGEAVLYLDAAYGPMVRPGSRFDVYVNGRITATLPLNGARGGIFQRFPLRLLLRNFKVGHQRRRHRERAAHRRRRAMPAGWNPARPEPLRSLRHDRAEISRIWPYRPHARSRCPVGLRISVSHRATGPSR